MVRRLQHAETMRAGVAPSLPHQIRSRWARHLGILTSGHACLGQTSGWEASTGGSDKLGGGPPWRNNLGFPIAYINIPPNTPHSYNEDNFGRLSLRILRLEKRLFALMGLP